MGFICSFTHLFIEFELNSWIGKDLQLFDIYSHSQVVKWNKKTNRHQKYSNTEGILFAVLNKGMNKFWKLRKRR